MTSALPDLISELESVNEQLSSNEEGELTYIGRRDLREKRDALAMQIAERETAQHPSVADSARRARGLWRFSAWMPEEYRAKLDALCEETGFSRAEQIEALIDWETSELARIASTKKKPRSA